MGGHLTVSSKEHVGSTFTFVLPYKVSLICDNSDDPDELPNLPEDDITAGFFRFQPCAMGSLFSSNGPARSQKLLQGKVSEPEDDSDMFPASSIVKFRAASFHEDASSVNIDVADSTTEPECSLSRSPHPDEDDDGAVCKTSESEPPHKTPKNQSTIPSSEIVSCIESQERGSEDDDKVVSEETSREKPLERPEKPMGSPGSVSCLNSESSKPEKIGRILLVEDSKINVMVAQSMTKQMGHKMDVVSNGVEAIRAVQRFNYDLILMVIHIGILNSASSKATHFLRFSQSDIFFSTSEFVEIFFLRMCACRLWMACKLRD